MICPNCDYNKARADLWRSAAYEAGGTPLPWNPDEKLAQARQADEALLRQALTQMERHQPTVADTAPHVEVMAYNATITALRERLGEKQ